MSRQALLLETSRLFLKPFVETDLDRFAEICASPKVMRYIGNGEPLDKSTTQLKLLQWIDDYRVHGYGLLATFHKFNEQLIGFCGLINQTIDGESQVELGYRLAQEYWGCGLATEAAIAVRDYAFQHQHFPQLIAIIHQQNLASKRVASKIGMQFWKTSTFYDVNVDVYHIFNNPKTAVK